MIDRAGAGLRKGLLLGALVPVAMTAERAELQAQQPAAPAGAASANSPVATAVRPAAELAAFHRALAALERGERRHVEVLQIGDSHTAADHFSGRLRSLLQQRFGNAGRGFLPPGAPHDWYRPYQVSVSQSKGWRTLTSNKTAPDAAAFGLSGVVARAADAADAIVIERKSDEPLRALEIGLVTRPDHGSLEVRVDGAVAATLASNDTEGLLAVRIGIPAASRRIELRPFGDGPVEISDHSLLGARPGVRVSNVGFIGAQVSLLSRWSWPRAARQIADLDPALVILAFGTNEGHAPVGKIAATYMLELERHLRALKAAAPNASIVVVGPPDAGRYPRYCLPKPVAAKVLDAAPLPPADATERAEPADAANAPGTTRPPGHSAETPAKRAAKPPPPEPPVDATCEPLSESERAGYDRLIAAEDRALCRWHTPAAFPIVRSLQREVAQRNGALFFDWYQLFEGGECGADRWFRAGLAHKDRVHFKQDGYWRAADRLHRELLAGYAAARAPVSDRRQPAKR